MSVVAEESIVASIAPPSSAPIEERLRREATIWLSSIRPDGRPHVVPVWFFWNGQVFDLFSKPTAQKVRNVREHPDVMIGIGEPDEEWDVELIEGTATALAEPTAHVVSPALFDKYAAAMQRAGLDRDTYVRVYSQPVRIRPTRFVGYGGKGWVEPAPNGDTSDVVGHMMRPAVSAAADLHRRAIHDARLAVSERKAGSLELAALDE